MKQKKIDSRARQELYGVVGLAVRSGQESRIFKIVTSAGDITVTGKTQVGVKVGNSFVQKPAVSLSDGEKIIIRKERIPPEVLEASLRTDERYDSAYKGIHYSEGVTALRAALFSNFAQGMSAEEWTMRVLRQGGKDFTRQAYDEVATLIVDTLSQTRNPSIMRARSTVFDWLHGETLAPRNFRAVFETLLSQLPGVSKLLESVFRDSYQFYVTVKSAVVRAVGDVVSKEGEKRPRSPVAELDQEESLILRLARQYVEEVGAESVAARVLAVVPTTETTSGFLTVPSSSVLSPQTIQQMVYELNSVEKVAILAALEFLAGPRANISLFYRAVHEARQIPDSTQITIPLDCVNMYLRQAVLLRYGGDLAKSKESDRLLARIAKKSGDTSLTFEELEQVSSAREFQLGFFNWIERDFAARYGIPMIRMEDALAGWAERLNSTPLEISLLWAFNSFIDQYTVRGVLMMHSQDQLAEVLKRLRWGQGFAHQVLVARYPNLSIPEITKIRISDYRSTISACYPDFARVWPKVEREVLDGSPFVNWDQPRM